MKNNFTKIKVLQQLSKCRAKSLFIFLIFIGIQSAKAQFTAIPDTNFEQALITLGIDSGAIDHQVLTANVSSVTYLYVSSESISSLVGIQAFTSLTDLYCGNNQLSSLDVSSLNNLQVLNCNFNQLTTLNISNNASLLNLDCRKNNLNSLSFSGVPNLTSLACGSNKFTTLNVSSLSSLTYLNCEFYDGDQTTHYLGIDDYSSLNSNNNYLLNTPLTSLTVTGLANLEIIYSSGNNLTSLNLTGLTSLSILKSQNNISSINLSGLSNLTYIDLMGNPLTSLNISGLNNLDTAYLAFTNLTSLNASGLTHLKILSVQTCTNLSSLNITGCTALVQLNCRSAKLSTLSLSGCNSLQSIQCEDNKLTSLNLSGLTALISLDCGNYDDVPGSRNQITSINFTGATSLKAISCYRNLLTNLNLSALTNLENLDCSFNEITSLNLTGLNAMTTINCSMNAITNLTLPGSTALVAINCAGNQISSLNLSGFVNLIELQVGANLLTSLDLRNLTNLTNMEASNNTMLNCISTDNVSVANANASWLKDAGANYSTNCNGYIPTSKVKANQCGITLSSLTANINADYVAGYQAYRFEVSNGITFNTVDVNKYNFSLTKTPGITYGTTYSVRVAVNIGGTWGAYGASCNVTTPVLSSNTVLVTKVFTVFCGTTLDALDTKIGAMPVPAATGYRFEITSGSVITTYDSAVYNFRLAQAGVAAYSTTYSIRVAAQVNGVYGNYGASCIVTTPAAPSEPNPTPELPIVRLKAKTFEVSAYPNPFESAFNLNLETPSKEEVTIAVYDMMGKLVETHQVNPNEVANLQIGNNFAAGIYNVIVSQANEMQAIRLIRK